MGEVGRFVGSIIGTSLHAFGSAVHGLITGSHAVVEVAVDRRSSAQDRVRLIERLERLGHDPRVAAVLLDVRDSPGNWAAVHDLRLCIGRIRAAGTPVYASVDVPTNATYWLASAAERVFVPPTTEVNLVGLGVEVTFFGSLLKRLGIETDFEAAGTYKSAAEPFARSFPSPDNHEALSALVGDLQAQLAAEVADARELSVESVQSAMAEAPLPAERALELGLVDQLAYRDEVRSWLQSTHEGAKFVDFAGWARRDKVLAQLEGLGQAEGTLAILHLEGNIVSDDASGSDMIRSRTVVPLLRQLSEDDSVAAVVLHVNSPGGSAVASDLIWREVDQLRSTKPVVACFEDVSASGGVYLSAPCSEIVARPGSLTGSIGVVGGKLVVGEGLRKLGVHSQPIEAAPHATVFSNTRRFTPDQRERFRASLTRFYNAFVNRVADGRNRDPMEIEPHCRGRVWTGRAAVERGLVDRVGDFNVAIERATALAGLTGRPVARRHLSSTVQNPLQRLAQQAARSALPGAAQLAGMAEAQAGEALALTRFWGTHSAQPLAWLPWRLRLR